MTKTTLPYPFRLMPLDIHKVFDLLHTLQAQGAHYGLGAKALFHTAAPHFHYPPELPNGNIDCSGFARIAIFHGTAGAILLPDGSANQGDYLAEQNYKRSTFANTLLHDSHVRLCIARRNDRRPVGHIWGTYNGFTFESHGGVGPASRPADTPILRSICDEVYVVC